MACTASSFEKAGRFIRIWKKLKMHIAIANELLFSFFFDLIHSRIMKFLTAQLLMILETVCKSLENTRRIMRNFIKEKMFKIYLLNLDHQMIQSI